jgi:archaeoflavoprotein AfpA
MKRDSMVYKILWGITGSGDKLIETINLMKQIQNNTNVEITVALSINGELVVRMYNLWQSLQDNFSKVYVEKGPNDPFLVAPLQLDRYNLFIVCPATANTTAKIAYGIADSLLSNCVSQALKADVKLYIYPVDQKIGQTSTILPNRKELILTIREIDVENAERLKRMKGVRVISELEDIDRIIRTHLSN